MFIELIIIMKILKIIIGSFLLLGAGAEYVNASKQLLTFFDPGILCACLAMIFISSFLIASGFSKTKIEPRSWKFLLYCLLSFFIFLIIAFFNLITYKFDPNIIKTNGFEVDIAPFMNGSQKIIPDEKERREYCICVVTKLTRIDDITKEYVKELRNGDIDKILIDLKGTKYINELNLPECAGSIQNIKWTDAVEKGMRENIMSQIKPEFTQTNNATNYCDCLIEEYKKLPLKEVVSTDFYKTSKNYEIDSICALKSKIK